MLLMTNRYSIALSAAVMAIGTLCASPAAADTKRFGITSYDRIEVIGDMVVDITPSHLISAVAEGNRADLDVLDIAVRNRVLVIRNALEGPYGQRPRLVRPVRIRLTAQNLSAVSINGGAQVTVSGLRTDHTSLAVNGVGRINATGVTGRAIDLSLNGAGEITVTGRVTTASSNVAGAGQIDASALLARDLEVRAAGGGHSRYAASTTATVFASGAANVTVTGDPRCTVNNLGAGTIACGNRQRNTLPGSSSN